MVPFKPFYMIRHGQTVSNAAGLTTGSAETELTDKGRAQAREAGKCLALLPEKPVRIVSSTLSRAKETARLINGALALPQEEDSDLIERSCGDWTGQPWKEVEKRLDRGEVPPNGESVAAIKERVARGMSRTLAKTSPVLFVVHGGVIVTFWRLFGADIPEVSNCILYGFKPAPEKAFPWDVTRYSRTEEGALSASPFSEYA